MADGQPPAGVPAGDLGDVTLGQENQMDSDEAPSPPPRLPVPAPRVPSRNAAARESEDEDEDEDTEGSLADGSAGGGRSSGSSFGDRVPRDSGRRSDGRLDELAEDDLDDDDDERDDDDDDLGREEGEDTFEGDGMYGFEREPGLFEGPEGYTFSDDGLSADPEEMYTERSDMMGEQLGMWGHSLVTFSSVGVGLYSLASVLGIDFPRFLGMVLLLGMGMLAARPRYNPNVSSMIDHGLSEGELETIRVFHKRRVDLRSSDGLHRDEFLGRFKRSSYGAASGNSPRRRRQESYEQRRPGNYYPEPEPFEDMLEA